MLRVTSHSIFNKIIPAVTRSGRNLVIAPLESRDIPVLAAMARKTYEETCHGSIFTPELCEFKFGGNYINEVLPRELANKNIMYLVCKDGRKLIGYAKIEFNRKAIRFYECFGFKLQSEHQRHIYVVTGDPTNEFYVEMACDNMSEQLKSRSSVNMSH